MTLSFPLSLAAFSDKLLIVSAPFVPMPQVETSSVGAGEFLTAELGPTLIEADVTLRPLAPKAARSIKALVEAVMAVGGSFYLADPLNWWPTHDLGGTKLGASTVMVLSVNADQVRVALQGLPNGYVLENDLIAIDYGSPTRRFLARMMPGSVTAGGDGKTAQFEVRPALRAGIATGSAVTLLKPAIKAKIVPGSVSYGEGRRTVIGFRARQTLQAG